MDKKFNSRSYQRMGDALKLIEESLDESLSVSAICQRLHVSEFHFQRQFKAYWGVSFAECVRLLRVKRAAYCLAFRLDSSLLDIAFQAGYDSAEAFSRAFKRYSSQSPREFRAQASWKTLNQKLQILECIRELQTMNTHYTVDVIELNKLDLIVYCHQGPVTQLGNSIGRFIAWRKVQRLSPAKARTFNRLYEDPREAGSDFRFELACEWPADRHWEVDLAVLEGEKLPLSYHHLPVARYARIQHQGSDEAMSSAIEYLYEHWLPESGEELADAPLLVERLTFFPEVPESQAQSDLLLPLA